MIQFSFTLSSACETVPTSSYNHLKKPDKINVQITKMEESLKTCRDKKHMHHEISVTNQVFSLVKYYTTPSLPVKLQLVCCILPINYRL